MAANARYNDKLIGRTCDKYMGHIAANKSLAEQYNFAVNCLNKIKEETGRYHDAYMLWIANIHNAQGNGEEALNWAWWAIGQTRKNNQLDSRGPNDFLSIAYMSLLLHMTDGFRSEKSLRIPLSASDAKVSHDISLAVIKLSGCKTKGTQGRQFYGGFPLQPGNTLVDFNVLDTTLSAEDSASHCAFSGMVNLLSRMAITNNTDSVVACEASKEIAKALADKRYQGFRNTLGAMYTRMVARLSDGRCEIS
ncbi:hypothetical protein [Synechococcus sp. MIT S9451]|uniref:hypothetical protein n=1 Tax=Synechococcus sp. MIT S9451 TaxID=3082543 RepID=UPI0039B5A3AE